MAETTTPKKKRVSPVQFAREVRQEARKVTWTPRRETFVTTIMVFIMVAIAAVFLFAVDFLAGSGVRLLLEWAPKFASPAFWIVVALLLALTPFVAVWLRRKS